METGTGAGSAGGHGELARGRLGTGGVVFLTLAMVTPIGAVTSAMALGIALGNGPGMPGIYVLVGLVLLCFAAGYAAMSRHVTNAGAFYAYVTRGLGRIPGAAAAAVALLTYNAAMCAVAGAFGFFAHLVFADQLGIDLPWQAWLAIALAVIALLGRRQVDVSARLLGTALVVEMLILIVLDVAIVADRGLGAFSLQSFDPGVVFSGAVGVAIVFGFYSYGGFEATAIYSEESRDPRRTVARATYLCVGIITVFYLLTAWALVSAFGGGEVQRVALEDPGSFVFLANTTFVGDLSTDVMQFLVVSSLFASLLGIHNSASRYFYALGRDGVLPRVLSRTHPRHGAPYVASAVQISLIASVVAIFALAGADPLLSLSTSMGGLATLATMSLWAAASLACAVFFLRRREVTWATVVAPLVAACGLVVLCVLVLDNYSLLTGATGGLINQLPWLVLLVAVVGATYALWLRRARSAVYARIGGADADPVPAAAEAPAADAVAAAGER